MNFIKYLFLLILLSSSLTSQAYSAPAPYIPTPPKASDGQLMTSVESYLRATLPDPDSYEPLDWSGLVLYEEDETHAYRWGIRHTYRVSHPIYRVLYIDRIFLVSYDGLVESIIEYERRPCLECKW